MSKKPMIVGYAYGCVSCERHYNVQPEGRCECVGLIDLQEPVTVVFRRDRTKDGEVTAVMPLLTHNGHLVTCYAHVGQHGSASRGYIDRTRPATPEEYAPLLKELTSAPYFYRFRIVQRWPKHGTPMEW